MSQLASREQRAHHESVAMSIADVASYLQEAMGQRLVAFMAGIKDPKAVGQWAKGAREPQPAADERLRMALRIFHLLQEKESPHTVRAWFTGLNPQLADTSPASAIREGAFRDTLVAARAFLAGG